MGTTRKRMDFMNFILDSIGDKKEQKALAQGFLKQKNADDLYKFFQKNKYRDIPYSDCEDILTARKNMSGGHIPDEGQEIGTSDCPTHAKNY
jgi:hypothetical protein